MMWTNMKNIIRNTTHVQVGAPMLEPFAWHFRPVARSETLEGSPWTGVGLSLDSLWFDFLTFLMN